MRRALVDPRCMSLARVLYVGAVLLGGQAGAEPTAFLATFHGTEKVVRPFRETVRAALAKNDLHVVEDPTVDLTPQAGEEAIAEAAAKLPADVVVTGALSRRQRRFVLTVA